MSRSEYDQEQDSRPLSITEVLEIEPGENSWVNEGLIAVVRKIELITAGKKRWRCTLGDTVQRGAVLTMTLFFPPKFGEGDTIEITGKGIKRKEFNNYPEVSVG